MMLRKQIVKFPNSLMYILYQAFSCRILIQDFLHVPLCYDIWLIVQGAIHGEFPLRRFFTILVFAALR